MLTMHTFKVFGDYMARTKPYHHGNLRATLVAHGVKLLAKQGIDGLSLRTLARQAGVSPAAPYRHFRTAGALAEAIAIEGFERLGASMAATVRDPQLSRLSALERIGHGYLRFAAANPHHLQLMFSGRVQAKEDKPDDPLQKAASAALAVLTGTIVQAQKEGLVDAAVKPEVLAVVAWSFVHGFSTLSFAGCLDPEELAGLESPEQLAQACLTVIKSGWTGRKHRKNTSLLP